MLVRLPPSSRLAPFVECLWASDGLRPRPARCGSRRCSRTADAPRLPALLRRRSGWSGSRRIERGRYFSAVISGARSAPYFREAIGGVASVGGAVPDRGSGALLGVPAGALAGRHTSLDDVVGPEVRIPPRTAGDRERERRGSRRSASGSRGRRALRFAPRSEVTFAGERAARDVAVERVVRGVGALAPSAHRALLGAGRARTEGVRAGEPVPAGARARAHPPLVDRARPRRGVRRSVRPHPRVLGARPGDSGKYARVPSTRPTCRWHSRSNSFKTATRSRG